MSTYQLEFITPLFSRGTYEDRPEVRPASIRGQLHWWFRALGGNATDEKAVFGGVHGGATASKVVVRVSSVLGTTGSVSTLPHKVGGQASPKTAFQVGTRFDLQLLYRLGGLEDRLKSALDRTLETWLLLGTLGLRATRAAGSFRWEPHPSLNGNTLRPPADFAAYEARCSNLLEGAPVRFALLRQSYVAPMLRSNEVSIAAPVRFALLRQSYPAAEQARRVVSDTLGGRDDRPGQNDLAQLNYPLGKVFGGRKTSPLRFRIAGIGTEFRIAAVWDARTAVTGNRPVDLAGIINLLRQRKPALGEQLAASSLAANH